MNDLSKDIERFEEFEKHILNLDNDSKVQYKLDNEIMINIKKSVLLENFENDRVESVLERLSLTYKDLLDPDKFNLICTILGKEDNE